MKGLVRAALVAGAALALAGCGQESKGPAAIAFGEDACDTCRMIISEAPSAAQARFEKGRVEKYDDIGCLGERLAKPAEPAEIWVSDHGTGTWIDARAAFYVHSKELKTPMASGLAAFAQKADAEKFAAANHGTLVDFAGMKRMRRPE